MEKENGLTGAEWNVMECLWASSPRTGREATEYLEKSVGWTKSTTLTMLRRMTEKGLVKCDGSGEVRLYSPLVVREDAAMRETGDFINRIFHRFPQKRLTHALRSLFIRQRLKRTEKNRKLPGNGFC